MTEANKNAPKKTTSSSIWGGRPAGGPSQLMTDINASISYDRAMYKQDIAGSVAHATMLASQNIISEADLTLSVTAGENRAGNHRRGFCLLRRAGRYSHEYRIPSG